MAQKVFMNDKGLAIFKCPECENISTKDIGSFDKIQKVKRIKCRCYCGHAFTVSLEKRRYFRKATQLVGRYVTRSREDEQIRGTMIVIDVSQSGLMFKTNVNHDLEIGDEVKVDFFLDKERNISISKEGIIRRIIDRKVGIQFHSTEHYDAFGKLFIS